jgi:DNA-binding Xre family transcriptional regulator
MKVRHNLPVLMAKRKIKSVKELSRISGIEYPTLYNFYVYIHKKLDPEIIATLCMVLHCRIGDLLYLDSE